MYQLIYDYKQSCLKVYISQLKFCQEKSEYHSEIFKDYIKLLKQLKHSIDEVMDVYIPHATRPILYVVCPFCKENTPPHIKLDFKEPELYCENNECHRMVNRSRYLPCATALDMENLKGNLYLFQHDYVCVLIQMSIDMLH